GESLRAFAPPQRGLPERVIYCCTAEEARVPLLSAPARAMLLQQPASLAYAGALVRGEPADPRELAPLWEALHNPSLRPVLEQYETARSAREVMLHPDDLRPLRLSPDLPAS
ncbi:MAG TPA: 3-deoxy-D-arabino-heptulosonate 7-phosphate synthase, partial [Ramlibacter sp.]